MSSDQMPAPGKIKLIKFPPLGQEKTSNARGMPGGGGMLKLRFDWYITCTQTRIHRTQSLHYDKSLKRSSLRHIVTTNFAATIYRLLCEILLQRSLTRTIFRWDISKIVPISRWFIVSMRRFPDISVINRERSEQNAFFVDYCLHCFCTVL